jgi:hypothetical protein
MFARNYERYEPTACDIWQAGRIPRSPLQPWTPFLRWFAGDSEQNYQARGNHEFAVGSVGYQFNQLGYRGADFVREPGEALVLFVGDSNTFGIGIPWENLWTTLVCAELEKLWGVSVRQCNLAWKGSGADYAAMIVHQAIEALWPDVVCVLWSYVARLMWIPEPGLQVHFLPRAGPERDFHEHSAYLRLATESHGFFNYVRNFQLVDARLGRHGIPYLWGNLERLSPDLLRNYVPLGGYVGQWRRIDGDVARDGQHAGVQAHARFAGSVIETVKRDRITPSRVAGRVDLPVPTEHLVPPYPMVRSRPRQSLVPSRISSAMGELRLKRRIRQAQRKDPFIY